ncbi:mitochondria-eating protein [Crotalus adamanteus]|uniref:Mitochondria-eating protein n=1 Tax=Crotalus adamanteus TaxID=8729 RepID=A0AAW1BB07_CROAD
MGSRLSSRPIVVLGASQTPPWRALQGEAPGVEGGSEGKDPVWGGEEGGIEWSGKLPSNMLPFQAPFLLESRFSPPPRGRRKRRGGRWGSRPVATTKVAGSFRAAVASLTSEQKATSVCLTITEYKMLQSSGEARQDKPRAEPLWRPPSSERPSPSPGPPGWRMADTLRRLINNETCRLLQEKLESWYKDYYINSCNKNLTLCCEIMELNAMIQGQLFSILNQACQEGGHYEGMEIIKSRLLPWLGTCFSSPSGSTLDTCSSVLQESLEKDRLLRELSSVRSFEVEQLEKELSATRLQLSLMQQDLTKAQLALEDTKTKSATTLLAAEDEIVQLKTDLKASRVKSDCTLEKLEQLDEYENRLQTLNDEIAILRAEKSLLQSRLARSRSSSPRLSRSRSPSPLSVQNFSPSRGRLNHALRHARLVERFNNAYSQERLNAQTLLRSYADDLETVQRIIYTAVVESFYAAKKAFRQFKMRVRKTLSLSYSGPEPLEDMVMDYIIRQEDLYDVQSSVSEVIRALNISPKISVPGVDFIMISSLIRELCRIAFSMQTLDPPLDVAFGTDGELFSEYKYRRSYDSDFTAPLVAYHVWPALMEEDSVVVKGEAVTKRGALLSSRSRNRSHSRSRSVSPLPRGTGYSRHLATRSRSPSPLRSGSPRK